jgi:phosphomannomutase
MNNILISGYDIRGTHETGLTIEVAWNVGKSFAEWLSTTGSIIIMTPTSQRPIADAVIEGLRLQGRAVIDGGQGDTNAAIAHITAAGLSGAVVVGFDEMEQVATIELLREDGRLIDSEAGLHAIAELVEAGNFVPAAVKGELTVLA